MRNPPPHMRNPPPHMKNSPPHMKNPPYTIHVHHQFGDHLQQPRKLPQPSKNPHYMTHVYPQALRQCGQHLQRPVRQSLFILTTKRQC
ncbi:hypothetical protein OSTOST_23547, partial [Ostertagia ostertagi]